MTVSSPWFFSSPTECACLGLRQAEMQPPSETILLQSWMINFVPNCRGLISPKHTNNAVLKIFSASITSVSSVLLCKENICFLSSNLQVESGP